MINEATIKRVATQCGFIIPEEPFTATCLMKPQFINFARAIEQLARQEQRDEDSAIKPETK